VTKRARREKEEAAVFGPGIGWQELMVILVIVGLFPLLIVLVLLAGGRSHPYTLRRRRPLPERVGVRPGAAVARGERLGAVAFSRRAPPSAGLAILLLLGGIMPGILYLLLGGRQQATTILPRPVHDGSELEIIASDRGAGGQAAADGFYDSLHALMPRPPAAEPAPARPVP